MKALIGISLMTLGRCVAGVAAGRLPLEVGTRHMGLPLTAKIF